MSADVRVTAASEFLAAVRKHKPGELPPSLLVREDAELRRRLGMVLDVASKMGLGAEPLEEEWRSVVGWEEAYEVSDRGHVFSLARHTPAGWRGERLLKPQVNQHGYPTVSLKFNGRTKTAGVHCLVTDAFLGPLPEGQERRHKDGNRLNCSLSNLEFGTPADNRQDAIRHGTHPRGSGHANARLTEEIVEEIRTRYAAGGISQRALAAEYGVHQASISNIILGKRWVLVVPDLAPANVVRFPARPAQTTMQRDAALALDALEVAAEYRRYRASLPCQACEHAPDGVCDDHAADAERAGEYDQLAGRIREQTS